MITQYSRGFFILVFTVSVLLLSGCKGGGMPRPQPAAAPEKAPSRTVTPSTQAQKMVIGTQRGGARQGVPLNLKNIVSTFAGKVGTAGSSDGSTNQAEFDSPKSITTDGISLYLADSNNHTVRKLDIASGVVTTLAGAPGKKGSNDGKGAAARFNRPIGITSDGNNLFVSDSNNHTIRQIDPESGLVTTIAGRAGEVGYVDGSGKRARFFIPEGITTDGNNLYVSDTHNHSIRKISLDSTAVSTIAGLSGAPGFFDDTGNKARFSYPKGITTDGTHLYVVDFGNHQIRKVSLRGGLVSTLSGTVINKDTSVDEIELAKFNYPSGITSDGRNLYVTDTFNRTVRKIAISSGVVTTIAGAIDHEGSVDGIGADAHFKDPVGITTDGASLFVTDSSHNTVRKIR
jgi:sugar lactone lactonase YvrE